MKTKALQTFETRLNYFRDDVELADVIRRSVMAGDLTDPTSPNVLKHVDPSIHAHLSRRRNSDGSRELIVGHLRKTVYAAFIKDAYEEVTAYLQTILRQALANGLNPDRIIGEHKFKMDAQALIKLGSWDAVLDAVAESLIQSLEAERSTVGLIKKVNTKLGLNLDWTLLNAALPFLELRHLLVHADGNLSPEYKAKHPQIPRKSNGVVNMNYKLVAECDEGVRAMVLAIDEQVVARGVVADSDCEGQAS